MGWKAFLRLQVRAELGPRPSVFTLRFIIFDVSARILDCEPPKLTWTIIRERRFHCKSVRIAGGRGSASENRQEPKATRAIACCHSLLGTCCLCIAAPATLPQCHSDLQLPPPWHQALEAVQWEEVDTRETSRTRHAKQMRPFLIGIWARGVDADSQNTRTCFKH